MKPTINAKHAKSNGPAKAVKKTILKAKNVGLETITSKPQKSTLIKHAIQNNSMQHVVKIKSKKVDQKASKSSSVNVGKNEKKKPKSISKKIEAKEIMEKPDNSQVTPALADKKQKLDLARVLQKSLKATVNTKKTKKIKKGKTTRAATTKKPVERLYEALPLDEEAFESIVNMANVAKIAAALKTLVENEVATKKTSIFSDYYYCLDVTSFKIPSCPKRMVKMNLKHPIVNVPDDDVVLVVPDLKRGAKVEYDTTTQHYTDLLREAGVEGITIMPFNQLRNEYITFEAKRKLANTFDYYLSDGRIVGHVVGFCGSTFQKPRTTFHSVRMDNPKLLKQEIEKATRRTAYKQLSKGDLISIPVGNDKFSAEQVAENIMAIVSQLKSKYPGGLDNMRGMNLKINIKGTSSLPLYASTGDVPAEAPYIVGTREQRMLRLKKEANQVLAKFKLTKEAELIKLSSEQIKRKRQLKETRAELSKGTNDEDQDDVKENAEGTVQPKKARIAKKNDTDAKQKGSGKKASKKVKKV